MTLRAYLDEARIKQADFARKVGCSRSMIGMIAQGRGRPRPDLARRIQDASGGEVRAHDLVFGYDVPRRKRP